MKTKTIKLMLMATALFSVALIASCSEDDKPNPADDKTELAATIASATTLKATTEEGTIEDQFAVGSQATLQIAIDAATEVLDDEDATQNQVNAANVNLQNAIEAYMDQQVAPIAAADLVGRWKFDEGSGVTAFDDTDNNFDGTFKTGHATWGAGVPTWTTDRHGNAGKAIAFDDGANIEVPYNSAINPTTAISISVWIKTAETRADNRFIGLQSWLGYKFQVQDLNHPFVSVAHSGGTYDRDGQVVVPLDQWHHLVATSGGGVTTLYVDGSTIPAATYSDTPNTPASISAKPYNLVFGQDFPTDKYAAGTGANFDVVGHAEYHVIPLAWGGYYHGSMDEIRIYKVALTQGQITSIYNNEKPD